MLLFNWPCYTTSILFPHPLTPLVSSLNLFRIVWYRRTLFGSISLLLCRISTPHKMLCLFASLSLSIFIMELFFPNIRERKTFSFHHEFFIFFIAIFKLQESTLNLLTVIIITWLYWIQSQPFINYRKIANGKLFEEKSFLSINLKSSISLNWNFKFTKSVIPQDNNRLS